MMFGNLSIDQMEKRMGIDFPESLKKVLKKYYQAEAQNIAEGYWHCFDMPFCMVCGNKDLAELVRNELTPFIDKIIVPLQIAIVPRKVGYTKEARP